MSLTYESAEALFKTARFPLKGKPIANNTRLHMDTDGHFVVTLHGHAIIIITKYEYILCDCGWPTLTTKNRMNEFTPFLVYQRDWEWYCVADMLGKELTLQFKEESAMNDGSPVVVSFFCSNEFHNPGRTVSVPVMPTHTKKLLGMKGE